MGSKFRYIIIFLLSCNIIAKSQETLEFRKLDSLTYLYYQNGEWDNLIRLGTQAINQNIDYKFLRQRLGYAYFIKSDYIESRKNFLKAYSFDSYDTFTLTYLYYSYLNSGKPEYAAYFAGKLNKDIRNKLPFSNYQLIESIDLEYNYKFSDAISRSDPRYYHLGINSRFGSGFQLYQMVSNYKQQFSIQYPGYSDILSIKQPEYYALLKYTFSPHWTAKTAYHYLNMDYSTIDRNANLGYLGMSANFGQLNLDAHASILKIEKYLVKQTGIEAGMEFSRNLNMYFTTKLALTDQQSVTRYIYDQKAGFRIFKKAWIEGNVTFGELKNYNDYDAMYVYNSTDITSFRGGAT